LSLHECLGLAGLAIGVPGKGDTHINEECIDRKIVGEYSQLKDTYQQAMKDYPDAKTWYTLYLTQGTLNQKNT